MMEQLIPVVMIVAMVAFILIKQIGKLTNKFDSFADESSYERYAKFSAIIQEHVREVKLSLDSSKSPSERPFKLLEGKNEEEALELLSNFIRKLVFFETMMAKKKSSKEIEADLFELLSHLDDFLKEYCVEGEALSDQLRERLLKAYEQLN
jgi:hypothetical protein